VKSPYGRQAARDGILMFRVAFLLSVLCMNTCSWDCCCHAPSLAAAQGVSISIPGLPGYQHDSQSERLDESLGYPTFPPR